ncbi:outer membrane protein assembly factor BamD [Candidatus Pelagibacter sp. RS40]|uniref:outer membrane protein assembly factor BamD n=1 Tax=Candidatus Pelagibacter sp. RS40 TaxID=1977865 RepID=UPI000A147835|nr:outer membrane protein assembly factor BamD [Candidatus Pelagibacter sp. RS40]ARJ48772.1 outer membrane protein assembly factor BamD [Candidatus Pelagibacter sp. RS40]
MNLFYKIVILIFFLNLNSCTKKDEKISIVEEKSLETQMIDAYNEGLEELEKNDVIFAAKKFNEAEIIYPQSIWAPRAALMAAYAYFSQLYYDDTIIELEKFLRKYKNHPRRDYAYYLLALSHYNLIVDETKDLEEILKAKEYFKIIIKDYPNTEFAVDAEFKLELIQEILASKEMYLARYYVDREKWIPAINRFKTVVNEYETTIYVEEALHRLVELHYRLGLVGESKKYAYLLGYNYQSSEWYEESYKIFNKNYINTAKKENLEKEQSILHKLKDLLK